jgi:hypothetical protein
VPEGGKKDDEGLFRAREAVLIKATHYTNLLPANGTPVRRLHTQLETVNPLFGILKVARNPPRNSKHTHTIDVEMNGRVIRSLRR